MRDPTAATHLNEATRDLLHLPDEQRIACIGRDLWIGYGHAQEAHSRLDRVLCSQRRMRPDNLLIVGASNNGKTAIARRFQSRHTRPEDPDADHATIPVALIQAPNGPRIPPLLSAVLQALGREPGPRASTAQLRSETYRAMADVGLRLLLNDDLHNVRGAGIGSLLVELRNLGSVTGVSLGCSATRGDRLRAAPGRAACQPLRAAHGAEMAVRGYRVCQVAGDLRAAAAAMAALAVDRTGLTQHVLLAANGLVGGIAGLLRQAAVEAIRTGLECIDRSTLSRAGAPSPERIEAVAHASDL